jgi:hypothetical protein
VRNSTFLERFAKANLLIGKNEVKRLFMHAKQVPNSFQFSQFLQRLRREKIILFKDVQDRFENKFRIKQFE